MENEFIVKRRKYLGNTSVVSARIPEDLIKKLNDVCEETGYSKNDIIQMCIEYAIDNIKIEK